MIFSPYVCARVVANAPGVQRTSGSVDIGSVWISFVVALVPHQGPHQGRVRALASKDELDRFAGACRLGRQVNACVTYRPKSP